MNDDPVSRILAVRSDTHGDFSDNARIAQSAKELWRTTPNWHKMAPYQREAIDLLTIKLARILSGDYDCEEHWNDLAGYPSLVSGRLGEQRLAAAPPSDTVRNVGTKGRRGVKLADNRDAYIGEHVVFRGSGAIGRIVDLTLGAGQIEVEWLGQPDDRLMRPTRNRVSWRDLCKEGVKPWPGV